MSLVELDRCMNLGASRPENVERWENDTESPTWNSLKGVASALNISMQDLLWPTPAGGLGRMICPSEMKALKAVVTDCGPAECWPPLEDLLAVMVEWINLETGRDKPVLQQAFALGRRFEREASE